MSLTVTKIKNAKPASKQYKLTDSDGLYLLCYPTGRFVWRMNYRFLGKQKTLSFGRWPDLGLAEARTKRDRARKLLAHGNDPAEQAKLEKIAATVAASNTFKAVADEWVEKRERDGLSKVSLKKIRWLLSLTIPSIGNRPINQITPHELLATLRKVETNGRYDSANRLRSTCGQIFRYAIATAREDRDIAADLKGALTVARVKHRAAITDAANAGALLRAIEGFEGYANTRIALQLLSHTFVRPGELRYAEWGEFDWDNVVWTIPAEKTKMRKPHSVPLSRQVLALISTIEHDASMSRFLFPSLRSVDRPMSENTVNAALRRMGFAKDEMTGHGFRAMAATLLNEMGKWNPDAIERQLAHVDRDTVRSAYTRGEYWDERTKMMQYWSDHLDGLRDGAKILKANFGRRQIG